MKFKIGDIVEVVNYGHLIFYGTKVTDINPEFIGRSGVIRGVGKSPDTNKYIYKTEGIEGKSAWWDEDQLKLKEEMIKTQPKNIQEEMQNLQNGWDIEHHGLKWNERIISSKLPDPIRCNGDDGMNEWKENYNRRWDELKKEYVDIKTTSDTHINPSHYKTSSSNKEVYQMMIDIWGVEAYITHCEISAFKYRMRAGKKENQPAEQDLAKAKWYEDKAKELREEQTIKNNRNKYYAS